MSAEYEALLLNTEVNSASPPKGIFPKNPENLEKNPFFDAPNT